jgi:BirA family biotin operon repressor/biotin-[acetyl-CoA-carboxylase] ligase
MDEDFLRQAVANLPVSEVRYYPHTGSTNTDAIRWAEEGAPDASLVFADEQTAGRGRADRTWTTPPGTALAFSLIFRPTKNEITSLGRWTGLGALAVHAALQGQYGLPALIKWPNDVLVRGRKLCGILAEAQWNGSNLTAVILGIGINVASSSVSEEVLPSASLRFPATSVESELGGEVDRLALFGAVVTSLFIWRKRLPSDDFLQAWESALAYKGEWVRVVAQNPAEEARGQPIEGQLIGLAPDGSLRLQDEAGHEINIMVGELRPIEK